jgi:hypothetical protein
MKDALRKLKFLLYHSSVFLEFGHYLYAQVKNAETLEAAAEAVEHFFEAPHRVSETTTRRH